MASWSVPSSFPLSCYVNRSTYSYSSSTFGSCGEFKGGRTLANLQLAKVLRPPRWAHLISLPHPSPPSPRTFCRPNLRLLTHCCCFPLSLSPRLGLCTPDKCARPLQAHTREEGENGEMADILHAHGAPFFAIKLLHLG